MFLYQKKKTDGQASYLSFLGLGIDTVNQSICVPSDKVVELQEHIMEIQDKNKNYTPVSGWFTSFYHQGVASWKGFFMSFILSINTSGFKRCI